MRNIVFLIIVGAFFASCQNPTHIQIVNDRAVEKTLNYGLGDYYSDTGRIRNVEHIYLEYGEICDIQIVAYKYVTSGEASRYDVVEEIFLNRIEANSMSEVIEIASCDRVDVIYLTYAYDNYYLNSQKIDTKKVPFDQKVIKEDIKYGKMNRIIITE